MELHLETFVKKCHNDFNNLGYFKSFLPNVEMKIKLGLIFRIGFFLSIS